MKRGNPFIWSEIKQALLERDPNNIIIQIPIKAGEAVKGFPRFDRKKRPLSSEANKDEKREGFPLYRFA